MEVAEVLDRLEELTGKRVLVRGLLRSVGSMTLVGCMMSCCNSAHGLIALWPPQAKSPPSASRSLALWDAASPDAYLCGGDDSWLCCPFETEIEALAYGRVEPQRYNRMGFSTHALSSPRLCALRPSELPSALRATEAGCVLGGTRYAPEEHVDVGDQMCGCHGGRVSCRSRETSTCFYGGRWFADGWGFQMPRRCEYWQCKTGSWVRTRRECVPFIIVRPIAFEPRSTKLLPAERRVLDALAPDLESYPGSIRIIGLVDPGEGRPAKSLALERARRVKQWLVEHGVPFHMLNVEVEVTTAEGRSSGVDIRFIPPK
jgi:hypothetical protein